MRLGILGFEFLLLTKMSSDLYILKQPSKTGGETMTFLDFLIIFAFIMFLYANKSKLLSKSTRSNKSAFDDTKGHETGIFFHSPNDPAHGGPKRRYGPFGGGLDKAGGHVDRTTGEYHTHDYNKQRDNMRYPSDQRNPDWDD